MQLYQKLSQVGFLKKSYAFKFLFVAFIGIHIPLIGILFFVLYVENSLSPTSILIFTLILTLLSTGITLFILKKLIKPIEVASKTLDSYRLSREIPNLPLNFYDEAGLLMKNIQESIEENETLIKDRHDLVHLMSHDLRTFTGNSNSLSKLITEEKPSETIREYADLIYQSTTQQLHFIESFIQLIKDQEDISNAKALPTLIDLGNVLTPVKKQVAQQLSMKNIHLHVSLEVYEVVLKIDSNLLIRVLVNLIDNAIKFSHSGSTIEVRGYSESNKLYLTVTDEGLGFDSKDKKELFEKFTKASKPGTAAEPSTGIGLYLCKRIVEKYNGQILAESKGLNQGAIFTVIFDLGK